MDAKPATHSKTILFNVLVIIASIAKLVIEAIQAGTFDPAILGLTNDPALYTAALGVVGIVLRAVTKDPVKL
jgi:hypothetical protein